MVDAGLIVVASSTSPLDSSVARSLFAEGEFVELFLDAAPVAGEARVAAANVIAELKRRGALL